MGIKLGLGLYRHMLDAQHLRFAAQAGATHIVAHLPGNFGRGGQETITSDIADTGFGVASADDPVWTAGGLRDLKTLVNEHGLELAALENFSPAHWYDVLLDGPRKREQLEHLKQIVRDMGGAGIPVLGYNFSIAGVWGRSRGPFARGGAVSVGFEDPEQTPIPAGMVWNMIYDSRLFQSSGEVVAPVSQEQLWQRYAGFLEQLLPVAEQAGVALALHPDDPPLAELRGTARLVHTADGYQRVLDLHRSPANQLEFCIGTLSEIADADIYELVERYSATGRIAYVHLRNVRGRVPNYYETFVDDGDTDMLRILRILHRSGFDGVIIPDHTPGLECAAPWHAGMAYALGWMRAAITLIEAE